MEAIRIEFTPTEKDYVAAAWQLRSRTLMPGVWLMLAVIVLIVGVVLCQSSLNSMSGTPSSPDALQFTLCLTVGPFVILTATLLGLVGWSRLAASARVRRDPRLLSPVIMEIDDSGIHVVSAIGDVMEEWKLYQRALMTNQYYLLWIRKTYEGRFIPRSAFTSLEQEFNFELLLKRKLNFSSTTEPGTT